MAQDILTASTNDLLLNYVQAYVEWLNAPDSPEAFENNQRMVVIQNEFKRREEMRTHLIQENKNLQKLYGDCMEQLNFNGGDEN